MQDQEREKEVVLGVTPEADLVDIPGDLMEIPGEDLEVIKILDNKN